jgi:hypothetical protein
MPQVVNIFFPFGFAQGRLWLKGKYTAAVYAQDGGGGINNQSSIVNNQFLAPLRRAANYCPPTVRIFLTSSIRYLYNPVPYIWFI